MHGDVTTFFRYDAVTALLDAHPDLAGDYRAIWGVTVTGELTDGLVEEFFRLLPRTLAHPWSVTRSKEIAGDQWAQVWGYGHEAVNLLMLLMAVGGPEAAPEWLNKLTDSTTHRPGAGGGAPRSALAGLDGLAQALSNA